MRKRQTNAMENEIVTALNGTKQIKDNDPSMSHIGSEG